MHKVNIRSFKEIYLSESENLLKEHLDIFSETDIAQFKKDLLDYLTTPRHATEQGLTFVIVVNKVLSGLIMYQKDPYAHSTYNIKWLAIKRASQNKGYGTRLVHEVFKRVRKVGGKHVYLETSNERHNDHAKKFYEDLGFKKVGVLPDYYDPAIKFPRKLEDGIIYHKAL